MTIEEPDIISQIRKPKGKPKANPKGTLLASQLAGSSFQTRHRSLSNPRITPPEITIAFFNIEPLQISIALSIFFNWFLLWDIASH